MTSKPWSTFFQRFPSPPFPQANLSKADATNAVIDRVDFSGSNLTGMTLRNAIITG